MADWLPAVPSSLMANSVAPGRGWPLLEPGHGWGTEGPWL